jgi:hypothetical protein
MRQTHKSSAGESILGIARAGFHSILFNAVLFLVNPAAVSASPYPIPGTDDDPNHCSGRKGQSVIYCVTPPAWAHCVEIMSESSPLYLGYRYECDPAPDPSAPSPEPSNR